MSNHDANHGQTLETDVLVVGGGTAGVGAAVAAARTGAETLLIERYGFLGGVANVGLCLHTFHSSKGERVVAGLPWEMITRMREMGGSTGPVFIENAHMQTTTPIDVEVMKYVTQELILEAGGTIQYHTNPLEVLVENGRVAGVVVTSKGGRQEIRARRVIDATGDGDIATWAGVPFEKGRTSDGKMQRMSLVFKLGNVDLPRAFADIGKGAAWAPLPLSGESYPVWWSATLAKYADTVAEEDLFLGIDEFWGNTVRARETNINASRLQGLDGTQARDLSTGEIEGKRQVFKLAAFLRRCVPGFENSYVLATAPFIGVRETRRMIAGVPAHRRGLPERPQVRGRHRQGRLPHRHPRSDQRQDPVHPHRRPGRQLRHPVPQSRAQGDRRPAARRPLHLHHARGHGLHPHDDHGHDGGSGGRDRGRSVAGPGRAPPRARSRPAARRAASAARRTSTPVPCRAARPRAWPTWRSARAAPDRPPTRIA